MKYRSSYGQNLLMHLAWGCQSCINHGCRAGTDPETGKRAGLLHDIGKVPDDEPELPHAILGNESGGEIQGKPEICNAIGAHHDETEMTTLIAPIVQVCDAISGARPGARREVVESYIKRLKELESLASPVSRRHENLRDYRLAGTPCDRGSWKVSDKEAEGLSFHIARKSRTNDLLWGND